MTGALQGPAGSGWCCWGLSGSTDLGSNPVSFFFFFFNFFNVYLFLRERKRDTEDEQGRGRERETQNPKHVPDSELSAQSLTWGSNSRAVRS